jgi:hypothetical protein
MRLYRLSRTANTDIKVHAVNNNGEVFLVNDRVYILVPAVFNISVDPEAELIGSFNNDELGRAEIEQIINIREELL